MGGDYAPKNPVEGAAMALREIDAIETLFLVGKPDEVQGQLDRLKTPTDRVEIIEATQVVDMWDGAAQSVRHKKDSSINRAVDLVKQGRADAVVSAGHTGAAVASTTIKLRNLPGIDRPGIAAPLPTETKLCVLIDAGANIDAKPIHLLQYAIMGAVYSRHVLGCHKPTIGLMSIGGEDMKGSDFTREVFKLLKASSLNFRGNIEGHDLFENPVDVVLCEGFTGNVVLKTCEATAHAIFSWLKHELKASPLRLAGALAAKGAFQAIKAKTNYEEYGGSPLLGVDGICIIAHGSSTPLAIKNAIRVAVESVRHQVNPHIVQEIQNYHGK